MITPGLAFLGQGFLSLLFPCTTLVGIRVVLNYHFDFPIPIWSLVAIIGTGVPLVLVARIGFDDFTQRRRAAALGARMVPRIRGRWLGNLDVLMTMLRNETYGYPGNVSFICHSGKICSQIPSPHRRWPVGVDGKPRIHIQFTYTLGRYAVYVRTRGDQGWYNHAYIVSYSMLKLSDHSCYGLPQLRKRLV